MFVQCLVLHNDSQWRIEERGRHIEVCKMHVLVVCMNDALWDMVAG